MQELTIKIILSELKESKSPAELREKGKLKTNKNA
jgi:hypothetical protein